MRVVFDLDGTLVDSTPDLLAAINHVLKAHGLAPSDREENLRYAGHGLTWMFERTVTLRVGASAEDEQKRLVLEMGERYRAHPATLSRPFDGVVAMLTALQERGIDLCVISNKPSDLSQRILAQLFPTITFYKIFGPDSGNPPKPDPTSLQRCREGMGEGEMLIYVGDTEIDHQTGVGTADRVFLAVWGYRGRDALQAMGFDESHLLDEPMDLLSIVHTKGER